MPKNQLKNTAKTHDSEDEGLNQGNRGGCVEKLVSLDVVRNSGYILKEQPMAFYNRLDVVFEKMRDDFKIFEPKQTKIETPKIKLWISGIEVI